MSNHPNATASLFATGIASGLVYLARRLGYTLDSQDALLVAGSGITLVLYVGRRGIRETLRELWNGLPAASAAPPQQIIVHNRVELDGKTVADALTRHIQKATKRRALRAPP